MMWTLVNLFFTLCLSGPVVQRQNGPSSEEGEAQRRCDFYLLYTRAYMKLSLHTKANIKRYDIKILRQFRCCILRLLPILWHCDHRNPFRTVQLLMF